MVLGDRVDYETFWIQDISVGRFCGKLIDVLAKATSEYSWINS